MINVSILTIGDEICIGQVVNTNAAWLATALTKIGCRIVCHSIIGDEEKIMISELNRLFDISDIIITTGGLGPTHDDITKNVLCKYFKDELVFNEDLSNQLEIRFKARGFEYAERNKSQAFIPSQCIPLENSIGTAPGMMFENNSKYLFALPGVPAEMKYISQNSVIPIIQKISTESKTDVLLYKNILTTGITESNLADLIGNPDEFLSGGTLAFLPSYRGVRLRIGVIADNFELGKIKLERIENIIEDRAGKYIIGFDDETIVQKIGEFLKSKSETVSVAESCTGGMLGASFTDIAGSSDYFVGGIIAYSNDIKIDILNVKSEIIKKYGAVSSETALELAKNVRQLFNTDYGISITGIAGPGGGTDDKPVGTVWIGIANRTSILTKRFQFVNDRAVNRERAVGAALAFFLDKLKNNNA